MFDKIVRAFDPIIQLLQAISYPIAFVCAALAILMMMIGQKRKGMEVIKWAAIGYLLMQMLPGFMSVLHSVGQAISK